MSSDPAYVRRLLDQARQEGQWYCGQPDAVALCFEVLALFPDSREAADLVYESFCDEWLIYDNRVALQRLIDEWDDRPRSERAAVWPPPNFLAMMTTICSTNHPIDNSPKPLHNANYPIHRIYRMNWTSQ